VLIIHFSIIIAHYAPDETYRKILKETIKSIRNQVFDGKVEIIVTDDGSDWARDLINADQEITFYSKNDIQNCSKLQDLAIDLFIAKRRDNTYCKAKLWNLATSCSKYSHLIFLDDDHYLKNIKSLRIYSSLFGKYRFIIGRIQESSGLYRLYSHFTVQGTNIGIEKKLLAEVGGFGEYTSQWGRGEDSDIFLKIYQYAQQKSQLPIAGYAGNIITRDMASGRWKKCKGSEEIFIQGFQTLYGTPPHDVSLNKSRDKKLWVHHTSKYPGLSELYFKILNGLYFIRFQILSLHF